MQFSFPSSLAKNELWLGLGWVVATKPPERRAFSCTPLTCQGKPPNLSSPTGMQREMLEWKGGGRLTHRPAASSERLSGYQERLSAEADVQESEKAGIKRLVDTGWSPGGREPGTEKKQKRKGIEKKQGVETNLGEKQPEK